MSQSIIGKLGKNLVIRLPMDVARMIGLAEGETVKVEARDGDIVIRRRTAHARARQDAEKAAAEIIADSRRHSLGSLPIRDMLEDTRRG